MISVESILGMICTEAIENTCFPSDHYYDETRDPHYAEKRTPPIELKKTDSGDLPLFRYDLELIEMPDGSLAWLE